MQQFDVLIIGAGACGLMAAYELVLAGKKVVLVEAKDRTGGRIFTLPDAPYPVELGAEFIHGDLKLTGLLMKKAGISRKNSGGSIWRKKQGLEEASDFVEDYCLLNRRWKDLGEDLSVAEFFRRCLPEPEAEDLKTSLKSYVEGYYAADTEKASTLFLREEMESADEEQFRVEGGYGRIVQFLQDEVERMGGTILLSTAVQEIHWQPWSVRLNAAGTTLSAKRLLVTVSLGVWQSDSLRFLPRLPEKMAAAQSLGFGPAMKVILHFSEPFWQNKAYTEGKNLEDLGFLFSEETVPTWWTYYPDERPVLTGWLGGPHARKLQEESNDKIVQEAVSSLARIFSMEEKKLKGLITGSYVYNWSNDPYICGGYSYAVVGGDRQKEILRKTVAQTLYFAGEALHAGRDIGTVEAALVTGQETAWQIIAEG